MSNPETPVTCEKGQCEAEAVFRITREDGQGTDTTYRCREHKETERWVEVVSIQSIGFTDMDAEEVP